MTGPIPDKPGGVAVKGQLAWMRHGEVVIRTSSARAIDTDKLARVTELQEEVAGLAENYGEFGAEWGDRYTAALGDLAAAEIEAGLRSQPPVSAG